MTRHLAISLCLLATSCVVLPIPYFGAEVHDRRLQGEHESFVAFVHSIPVGQPREDLLIRLGQPEVSFGVHEQGPADAPRFMAWRLVVDTGTVLWAIGAYHGGAAGTLPVGHQWLLVVEFDMQGRVLRRSPIQLGRRPSWSTVWSELRTWSGTR